MHSYRFLVTGGRLNARLTGVCKNFYGFLFVSFLSFLVQNVRGGKYSLLKNLYGYLCCWLQFICNFPLLNRKLRTDMNDHRLLKQLLVQLIAGWIMEVLTSANYVDGPAGKLE